MISATDKVIKIFQYWNTKEVPKEVAKVMKSWKNHPNYRLQLYDFNRAKRFIKNNFSSKIFAAFKQCKLPAMQADFFRYCALYHFGGLYVDADIGLRDGKFESLKKLLQSCENGLIMTREKAIANDVIFVRHAKSPLIKNVLDIAVSNIENRSSNNVWQVTGPGIMTKLYHNRVKDKFKLFEVFEIKSFKIIREIVNFKWDLKYKNGEGHWTEAQKTKSIFKNSKAKTTLNNKIFCIGFNKTGTSSLHSYFQANGLKSLHNLIWQEASHYLGPKRFKTFIRQHDCYSDGEMANIERLYEAYPNAKFILNVRNIESWLKSRIKWLHRNYPKAVKGPMGIDYKRSKETIIETWIKRRELYHRHVLDFFKDKPNQLKILNVCDDPNWAEELSQYLNIEHLDKDYHSNKQDYAEMPKAKKEYLETQFNKIKTALKSLNIKPSTEVTCDIDLSSPSSVYDIRVDHKVLVRKRFK